MKKLLHKSMGQLTLFAFIVFALSIPAYLLLVDWIWLKELDENNHLIARRIEGEFNSQHISDAKLSESIRFWNEIQPISRIDRLQGTVFTDRLYTVRRKNIFADRTDLIDRFRGLKTAISINGRKFLLTVETNVEETEETVAYIAAASLFFFLILVAGFWILVRRHSKQLWRPFRETLDGLKSFRLHDGLQVSFPQTDIVEFAELNDALEQLLQYNVITYRNQKEFAENASHELQTPLAILKGRLDLLLQTKGLTAQQYLIAEEMNRALSRSAAINRNLLLLAKIENRQFDNAETLRLDILVREGVEELELFMDEDRLRLLLDIAGPVEARGNSMLVGILINNLLVNAIRHTSSEGSLAVVLSKSFLEISNPGTKALDSGLLFKRFSKLTGERSGSGLGLYIVREICGLHDWHISYRYEDGLHIFSVRFRA